VTETEATELLANAYGVPATPDAIAEVIITDTELAADRKERAALVAAVEVLVRTPGALESVQAGEELEPGTESAMAEAARGQLLSPGSAASLSTLVEAAPTQLVDLAMESIRRQLL
jgi:hypothetical protein